jgi:hypothetical protein
MFFPVKMIRNYSQELVLKTPPTRPPEWQSWKEIVSHSVLGSMKSFLIAFSLRGGVGFIIRIIAVFKQKITLLDAFKASIGIETQRFAKMISLFSFLWKLISNGLLYQTGIYSKRNGAIAGAIAGLAVLIETPENRITIGQQFFMRSMQAGKHALKQRNLIAIPHGDTLLFCIASASIMFAYTMYPLTIPREYYRWIVTHGRVPQQMVEMNREIAFGSPSFEFSGLALQQAKYAPSFENKALLKSFVEKYGGRLPFVPCSLLHPHTTHCTKYCSYVWLKTFVEMFPVYGALNVIPLLVLRTNTFIKEPLQCTKRMVRNTIQSSSFISTFVFLFQSGLCLHRNVSTSKEPKYLFYFLGGLTGLSILVEQKQKRAELAMYVLPKGLQSFYELAVDNGVLLRIPALDIIGTCSAFSIIMSLIQKEPHQLSPLLYKLIRLIVGVY